MSASSPNDELDRLLSRMTEARLSPEESRKLAGLIEADSECRLRYLDYCQMHAILLSEHGLLASTVEPSRDDLDQVGSHGRRAIWLALAAVLMIACLPLLGFRPSGSPIPTRGAEVAYLSHAVGASFEYGVAGELKTTRCSTSTRGGLWSATSPRGSRFSETRSAQLYHPEYSSRTAA